MLRLSRTLRRKQLRRNERGAILIFIAISTLALMSVLALALDGGALQRERRMEQTAADAAAIAGAVEIFRGRTDSVAASARSEATRNGYTNGGDYSVTVTYPATSGDYTGANYLQVTITHNVPAIFAGMLGRPSSSVRSGATAGITTSSSSCLTLLDTSATGPALSITAQARVTGTGCDVTVSNSDNVSPKAVDVAASSWLSTGGSLSVTGGVSSQATSTMPTTINTGVPKPPDPLGYLAFPTVPLGCDYSSTVTISTAAQATTPLSPGTYCGGIVVSGVSATMNGGVYYLKGGTGGSGPGNKALNVKSGGGLSGTNVTFVIDSSSSGSFGIIDIESGGIVQLSANTDAASLLPGVLFFANRAAPSSTINIFQSGSTSMFKGTLYFPSEQVEVKSSGANGIMNVDGALIAKAVSVHDNVTQLVFRGASAGSAPESQYIAVKKPTLVR